jgi:hypothetical protein
MTLRHADPGLDLDSPHRILAEWLWVASKPRKSNGFSDGALPHIYSIPGWPGVGQSRAMPSRPYSSRRSPPRLRKLSPCGVGASRIISVRLLPPELQGHKYLTAPLRLLI